MHKGKVLVVRLSALGDVALLVPVVRGYAQVNPQVRFTVAAPPMLQPLFAGMANVDFLGVDKKRGQRHVERLLQGAEADAVADMHGVARVRRALLVMWWSRLCRGQRVPRMAHIRKGRFSRWAMLRHLRHSPRKPQWRRYAEVFDRLGLKPAPLGKPLLSQVPDLHSDAAARPRRVGIAPFAQHRGKIWPFERSRQLALTLAERGWNVVLFGGRDEAPMLEQLAAQHEAIESVAGRYDFAAELECIAGLRVMVSMDSANMHFASAVGTAVVSLWGATHPDMGFYGYGQPRGNALCAGLQCQPCSAYGKKACKRGDYACMEAIGVDEVVARVEAVAGRD